MRGKLLHGDMLIVASMAIFSSYALFLHFLPEIPALGFLFALQVVGTCGIAAIGGIGQPTRSDLLLLIALAAAAIANDLCYILAFRATTVANAAISHQTVSVFLVFLTPLLLKEATQKKEWIALGVSLTGIGVLYFRGANFGGGHNLLGITVGVLSGFFYALVIILYKVILRRGLQIRMVNFWRYGIGTVLLLPFIPLLGVTAIGPGSLIPLLGFGVLFAVVATGIHVLGISRTRPLHASILGKTEPVFAILLALVVLGEVPRIEAVIGGVLIIGSSVWLTLHRPDGQEDPASSMEKRPVMAE